MKKPKGYTFAHERKSCWNCKFYSDDNTGKASQEKRFLCLKTEPPFDVTEDDICDEHEPLETK